MTEFTRVVEVLKGDGATRARTSDTTPKNRDSLHVSMEPDPAQQAIMAEFEEADAARASVVKTHQEAEPATKAVGSDSSDATIGLAMPTREAPHQVPLREAASSAPPVQADQRSAIFDREANLLPANSLEALKELPRSFDKAKQFLEEQFPEYDVLREEGRGGFKAVFKVRQKRTGAEFALKVPLTNDLDGIERLLNETRLFNFFRNKEPSLFPAASEIRNHNTRYFGILVDTVPTRIDRGIPATEALGVFRQMARIVECLHSEGFIHGDLKRSTFGIDRLNLLKILDLDSVGLTRQDLEKLGHSLSIEQSIDREKGLPNGGAHTRIYLAPEQESKEKYQATDVYHLCRLLYEVVTGRAGAGMLKPIEGALSSLNEVLLKGMDENWKLRHQTVAELLAEVERAFQNPLTNKGSTYVGAANIAAAKEARASEPDEVVAARVALVKKDAGNDGFLAKRRLTKALSDPSDEVKMEALKSLNQIGGAGRKIILSNMNIVQEIFPNHTEELLNILIDCYKSHRWEWSDYSNFNDCHKGVTPDKDFEALLIAAIALSGGQEVRNQISKWIQYRYDSPAQLAGVAEGLRMVDKDLLINSFAAVLGTQSSDHSFARVAPLAEHIDDIRVCRAFMAKLDEIIDSEGAVAAAHFGLAEEIIKAAEATKEPALLKRIRKISSNDLNPDSLRSVCQAALLGKASEAPHS